MKMAPPVAALCALALLVAPGLAQHDGAGPSVDNRSPPALSLPLHGDPRAITDPPTGPLPASLRVISDDTFPPLHFTDADEQPAGLSIDVMRAVCERLRLTCTIQMRRFDTLLATLAAGQADIVAAAIVPSAELRQRFDISAPYHRLTARFVGLTETAADPANGLEGVRVGVVRDSVHAAMLARHFPRAVPVDASDLEAGKRLLQRGDANVLFGDGQSLALWLGSRDAGEARFIGGAYLDMEFLGEGIGLLMRRDDPNLKRGIDHALRQLQIDGTLSRLFLRHFPVSPF